MNPSGSSKKLDYEASAGWTTYGTLRVHLSHALFYGVAFGCVIPGQSSVLKGVAGSPFLLYRLQVGYLVQA
jgi:hypothetical protein